MECYKSFNMSNMDKETVRSKNSSHLCPVKREEATDTCSTARVTKHWNRVS